jgi:hypothetical protein
MCSKKNSSGTKNKIIPVRRTGKKTSDMTNRNEKAAKAQRTGG